MLDRLKYVGLIGLMALIGLAGGLKAQSLPLSETATASVITCGPGDDFYTSFGHSAIRIVDTANKIDKVYNYGMFDFNEPNFYWHFMQGQLKYWVAGTATVFFVDEYRREGRAVWEQKLNFSTQEINALFIALEWNCQLDNPNRYYKYDFFRKNCATEVRDRILEVCGHRQAEYVEREPLSYRDYLHMAMRDKLEWWALGIDLLLGLPADHKCTEEDAMFYPLVMQAEFAEAKRDGKPLVEPSTVLLEETRGEVADSFPPVVVFTLLFTLLVVLHLLERRFNLHFSFFNLLTRILFVLAGLIGLFLLFMWFGTSHYCTQWNLNILWASPLLILIAIRMGRSPLWALWLQEAMFAGALVWVVWCHLSVAIIPMILTLALCNAMIIKSSRSL